MARPSLRWLAILLLLAPLAGPVHARTLLIAATDGDAAVTMPPMPPMPKMPAMPAMPKMPATPHLSAPPATGHISKDDDDSDDKESDDKDDDVVMPGLIVHHHHGSEDVVMPGMVIHTGPHGDHVVMSAPSSRQFPGSIVAIGLVICLVIGWRAWRRRRNRPLDALGRRRPDGAPIPRRSEAPPQPAGASSAAAEALLDQLHRLDRRLALVETFVASREFDLQRGFRSLSE